MNVYFPISTEQKPDSLSGSSIKDSSSLANHTFDSLKAKAASADSSFRFSDILTPANTIRTKVAEETKQYPSFFTKHELMPKNQNPMPAPSINAVWMFYVLLLLVAGFTWVKVFYYRTLEHILGSFVSKTMSNQMVRDENLLLQKASVLLTGVFYIGAALFIYQVSTFYNFIPDFFGTGFSRFLIIALMVATIYSFKFFILKIVGFIFKIDKLIAAYIFNIFLINNLLGIILLPVVIAIAFTNPTYALILLRVTIVIAIFLYLFRLMRGIMIGLSYSVLSGFYLFLYICSLEIVPLLIIIKALR
jgi:hypothetical protein